MTGFDSLLGEGSAARQLLIYGVGYEIARSILGPVFTQIEYLINTNSPLVELTPAEVADMVVRGIITDEADAVARAAKYGISADKLSLMIESAGEPPGLETVLEMYRRKIIGWDDTGVSTASVERAIKTSRIYNYWSAAIQANAQIPLSVGEAVDALLRGQTDRATALAEAEANGIDAARFDVLLNSAGRPPAPGELMELYRRKLIPLEGVGPGVVSFQQGIFEGDAKDKWWQLYAALAEYVPPPRTVTALLKTGSITTERAQQLWQDAGLTADMAAAYAKSATGEKLAGSRQLAEGTVLALYETQAITAAEAEAHLGALGYSAADVSFMLDLSDLQRELRTVNSAVTRVGSLYIAHKITRPAAAGALDQLALTPAHRDELLRTWDTERSATVRTLTPAQIVDAWDYKVITQAEAETELMALGYTAFDAWVLLSNKAKAPLPDRPAQGPGGPGVNP